MFGHQAPRRDTAWPTSPRAARRNRPSLLLILALSVALLTLGLAVLTAGCGSEEAAETTESTAAVTTTVAAETTTTAAPVETFPVTVVDDNGVSVEIKAKPMRIVSTAPSNTEILFALGLGDRIVGVTSLDDFPPEAADVDKVGDFQVNTEAVMALSPDLVVGYSGAEEALKPVQDAGAPVIILNPADLDGIYANILTIGTATGADAEAAQLVESLKAQIEEVTATATASGKSPKVFYALDNTLWTCGPGSFVDNLLNLAKATNVGADQGDSAAVQAYYQFAPEQLIAADPDVILIPNTAYTAVEEFTGDARFASLRAVKEGRVYLINDVVVTRPGPRIGDGLKTLVELIHQGAQ